MGPNGRERRYREGHGDLGPERIKGLDDRREQVGGRRGRAHLEFVFSWGLLSSRSRLLIQSCGCGGETASL